MFDHVTLRVTDRSASERFYRTVLQSLGIEPSHSAGQFVEWDDFSIAAADGHHPPTRNLHVAFVAPSRDHVDAFWRAGTEAGYDDDGRPGERPQYTPSYYGAFLRDPDGNSAEAVDHRDTRRGGHIDHLWLRVSDLGRARAFYAQLARHIGIRDGRRWDAGAQFRGPWATLSLVDDGAPRTENVHLAFPAPDRVAVEEFHRAALGAGYRDKGGPGERPQYHRGYYAAYVLDPDGNNVESVFHERL